MQHFYSDLTFNLL